MALRIPEKWERFRITDGALASSRGDGPNGCFIAPAPGRKVRVIVSNGCGWEHASVSLASGSRICPSWPEMSWVKDELWEPEDCVVQFHPPRSLYVNDHPSCLHLWRPIEREMPLPARFMVGRYEGYEEDVRKFEAWIDADPGNCDREPPAELFR